MLHAFLKCRIYYISLLGSIISYLFMSGCSENTNTNRGYVISQSQIENENDEIQKEN